jgi:hypothetical protein
MAGGSHDKQHGTQALPVAIAGVRRRLRRPLLVHVVHDVHVLNHPGSTQETKGRAHQLREQLETQLTVLQIAADQARVRAITFDAVVDEVLKHAVVKPTAARFAPGGSRHG